jgi:hypothetical protein
MSISPAVAIPIGNARNPESASNEINGLANIIFKSPIFVATNNE